MKKMENIKDLSAIEDYSQSCVNASRLGLEYTFKHSILLNTFHKFVHKYKGFNPSQQEII